MRLYITEAVWRLIGNLSTNFFILFLGNLALLFAFSPNTPISPLVWVLISVVAFAVGAFTVAGHAFDIQMPKDFYESFTPALVHGACVAWLTISFALPLLLVLVSFLTGGVVLSNPLAVAFSEALQRYGLIEPPALLAFSQCIALRCLSTFGYPPKPAAQ